MSRRNTPPQAADPAYEPFDFDELDGTFDPRPDDYDFFAEEAGLDAIENPTPPKRGRTSAYSIPYHPEAPNVPGNQDLYDPDVWRRTASSESRHRRAQREYDPALAHNMSPGRSRSIAGSTASSRYRAYANQIGWHFHEETQDMAARIADLEARLATVEARLASRSKSNASSSSSSSSSSGDSSSNGGKRKRSASKKRVSFDKNDDKHNDKHNDDGDDDDDDNDDDEAPACPSKKQKQTPAAPAPSRTSQQSVSPRTPARKASVSPAKTPKRPTKAAPQTNQVNDREEPTSPTPRRVTRQNAPRTPPRQNQATPPTPRAPRKAAPKRPTTRPAPIAAAALTRDVTAAPGAPRRSSRIRAQAHGQATPAMKGVSKKKAGGKNK